MDFRYFFKFEVSFLVPYNKIRMAYSLIFLSHFHFPGFPYISWFCYKPKDSNPENEFWPCSHANDVPKPNNVKINFQGYQNFHIRVAIFSKIIVDLFWNWYHSSYWTSLIHPKTPSNLMEIQFENFFCPGVLWRLRGRRNFWIWYLTRLSHTYNWCCRIDNAD